MRPVNGTNFAVARQASQCSGAISLAKGSQTSRATSTMVRHNSASPALALMHLVGIDHSILAKLFLNDWWNFVVCTLSNLGLFFAPRGSHSKVAG